MKEGMEAKNVAAVRVALKTDSCIAELENKALEYAMHINQPEAELEKGCGGQRSNLARCRSVIGR